MLASGRYAMLDDGMGFSLMPWLPRCTVAACLGKSANTEAQAFKVRQYENL
ncbi:hypothetical protein [Pectobacterium versatile]|uniref:hypothetical protein n=1 Tax=Pectobacterium versatile TaxID=2488639 RepID=UPI000E2F90BE